MVKTDIERRYYLYRHHNQITYDLSLSTDEELGIVIMETTLGAKINCAQNNLYTYVLSDISKTEIWKLSEMHEKCNFLLRNLTPLQLLLCDVVWLCYGYSSGLRSNFKSFKSLYSNQIQKDTRACITEEKIEIEWGALQLLKIDFKPLNDQ